MSKQHKTLLIMLRYPRMNGATLQPTTLPKRWPGQAALSWAKWHADSMRKGIWY